VTDRTLRDGFHGMGFRVVAAVEYSSSEGVPLSIEFSVYETVGFTTTYEEKPVYKRAGSDTSMDVVENIAEAQRFLHGNVKWDGCSNWSFDEHDKVMMHFCGVRDAEDIGRLFSALYSIARDLMPQLRDQDDEPEHWPHYPAGNPAPT
jgi:hypothetical protein